MFNYDTWLYAVLYFLLIIAFNYFYIAIQYNPIEMANNLQKNNGAIPGIRPGKPTSEFITKIISKITFVGSDLLGSGGDLPDPVRHIYWHESWRWAEPPCSLSSALRWIPCDQLESQMMMRHYKGFLE